ncbi:hypothetical protein CDD83_6683 [Cordyceps sp. RAO-2017]|nr:hypothetical protein CDD83_6683 [Cordyceps sp. RAO-2017]
MIFSSSSALALALGLASVADGAALHGRASDGCGQAHNFTGSTQTFSLESGGRTRSYRLHLPAGYDGSPRPLLLAFHGAGNEPEAFEAETRFSDPAVNPDMIAVYPAGVHVRLPPPCRDGSR